MIRFRTWRRIEPHARTTDIDVGLAAEVADPLWFLLRQWQLGELTGDDAGSPVAIDVAARWSRLTRFRAGLDEQGDSVFLDPHDHRAHEPVEARVEREPMIRMGDAGTPWTAAVQAGRALRRHLLAEDLDEVVDRLIADEDLRFSPDSPVPDGVESADDVRYRALLKGKVLDGVKVLALLDDDGRLPSRYTTGANRGKLATALTAWRDELESEWGVTDGAATPPAWVPDRLEYAFSLAAPPLPGDTEIVLQAAEYDGSGLEWYSLDRVPDASLGAADDLAANPNLVGGRVHTLLPTPLRYPGMPADRFWEMEDAAVALGRVGGGPTDLARMFAVDFAVVYGPDWYLAPVEVPLGCVARIDWVVVRDTFGVATLVGTVDTQRRDRVGRQFQPSDGTPDGGDEPLLVVLASALGSWVSDPREEVALQRDEVANLAWAIERQAMGPSGRAVPRAWFPFHFDLPDSTAAKPHELVWRLATRVPNSWTPLVAVHEKNGPRLLRKASILNTALSTLNASRSELLAGSADVREEEVTRAGIQLRLVEQLVRGPDGSTTVWRGREKRPWRGEASSGLRFDDATPKTMPPVASGGDPE